jgi:membrane protease YdiL (CAAX protease family)
VSAQAAPRAHVDVALVPVAVLTTGGLLLLLRAQALALGPARVATLLVLYAVLAALSVRAHVPAPRGALIAPSIATAVGVAAVVLVVMGPRPAGAPVLYGAWAAALATVAAIAEEAFFRRLMYGWLDRWWGPATAVVASAVAFALVHVPLYGTAVLWLDLGAGILLSWQRWASGSWLPSAATHVWANLLVVVR